MSKPIPDKAEVTLEYQDKLYIGTFEQTARFDAHLDGTGISLNLHRAGEAGVRKSVRMHFHYALFADILRDLGAARSGPKPVLVGFALETQDLIAHARDKLQRKKADLIVANHASDGLGGARNVATFVHGAGEEPQGSLSKHELADRIWDRVKSLLQP